MRYRYDEMIRQGDVILIPITLEDDDVVTPIVADDGAQLRGIRHRGEGGAHEHLVAREDAFPVRVESLGLELLRVERPTELRHVALTRHADAPHRPVALDIGYYEPRVQRVWSPGRQFRFAD